MKRFGRKVSVMNDEEILSLFNARDEGGIAALREKYGALIQSVAYGVLQSRQDAEECENDVLLRLWNAIPPAAPQSLRAYACTAARNIALDRLDRAGAAKRKGVTLPVDELAECIGSTGTAADRLDENELAVLLNGFLSGLDHDTRVIFMRRFWFGDGFAEISKRLGIGSAAARSRVSRTLKRLREYLIKEGYDL